ncbi:MAG: heparinase II/III family protein [Verrucomicrobiota bacterium]
MSAETVVLRETIPSHPRLLASNTDWERIRRQIQTDSVSARVFASLEDRAKKILAAPPAERRMEGRRLLGTSRLVLQRISTLAMVARVTGDKAYAKRAAQEMLAVAGFPDWNPSHFLDVAEMSLALAIGYDWLYDELSGPERAQIERALLDKGLTPSLPETNSWIAGTNNWNQVCHSGMSAAAIAIADLEPKLAVRILDRAIKNVPRCAQGYAPDGAYPEGPMYWGYGTGFHVILAAALQQFCGSAYGLDRLPGFEESVTYLAEVAAPSGRFFNYSDCVEQRELEVPLFWFARRFGHPDYMREDVKNLENYLAYYDKQDIRSSNLRLLAFALLWRDPVAAGDAPATFPLDWLGRGENPLAVFRSAFDDPSATYIAMKGGSPSLSHAHMDAGSFVLESDGIRWALDLGGQSYDSLESKNISLWDKKQTGERWSVFRLGPESHNILRFNEAPQLVDGKGRLVRFRAGGAGSHSVAELTSVYRDQVEGVHRGVMLLPDKAVLFQDEWTTGDKPVDVAWQMLTRAKVTVLRGKILLEEGGRTLTLEILEPSAAKLESRDVRELQKPFDTDNPGVQRIVVRTTTAAKSGGSFRILAIPGSAAQSAAPEPRKLLDWSAPIAP